MQRKGPYEVIFRLRCLENVDTDGKAEAEALHLLVRLGSANMDIVSLMIRDGATGKIVKQEAFKPAREAFREELARTQKSVEAVPGS